MTSFRIKLSPPQFLAATFLAIILIGTSLLCLPWTTASGESNFLTALFTATSATCVTGLVVVDTGTHWSLLGKIIILILMQVGGLGLMSFAVFYSLVLGKKIQLRQRLLMQYSLNKIDPGGVVRLFRNLLLFTFISEILGAVVLAANWSGQLGWKKALWFGFFHSVSAFNNAGFDLWGGFKSLTEFAGDPVVNLVIAFLVVIGGLGFVVVEEVYQNGAKKLSLHARVVLFSTLALIVGGAVVLLVSEARHSLAGLPWPTKVLAAFFQSVMPRTAGFNSLDLNTLLPSSQLLMALLMLIGGSPGSTAGGLKTTTLVLILAAVYSQLRGRKDPEIWENRIAFADLSRALAVVTLYSVVVFLGTFFLLLTQNASFMEALFEVCSAVGTVGLTLGLTGKLSTLGQILIILTMFLGRVGPLTLAFALAYKSKPADYRYPPGKVMIG